MQIQKAVVGALAAAGLFLSSTIAFAGTVYMASSGHPWVGGNGNIGPAWSLFNVGDASVCVNNSGSWVIPIAVPTSSSTVTRTVKARFTTGADGEVWSFIDLQQLAALPALVRQLQAKVAELGAKLAQRQPEDLVDVNGAAKLLGMTPIAVRSAAWRGSIPCVRVGSRLRFGPSADSLHRKTA